MESEQSLGSDEIETLHQGDRSLNWWMNLCQVRRRNKTKAAVRYTYGADLLVKLEATYYRASPTDCHFLGAAD